MWFIRISSIVLYSHVSVILLDFVLKSSSNIMVAAAYREATAVALMPTCVSVAADRIFRWLCRCLVTAIDTSTKFTFTYVTSSRGALLLKETRAMLEWGDHRWRYSFIFGD
jgi:hypothetical protein